MRRPLCLVCIVYLLFSFLLLLIGEEQAVFLPFQDGETVCVTGRLYRKDYKEGTWTLYLDDIRSVESDVSEKTDWQQEIQGVVCYMSEISETSGTAETSGKSETSGMTELSEMAETSGKSETSGMTELSGKSETFGMTETTEIFDLSEASEVSERPETWSEPRIGSYLQIKGKYNSFREASNLGQFDPKSYYQFLNLNFSITNSQLLNQTKEYEVIKELLYELKRKWAEGYERTCTREEAGFLSSIVLADKSGMDDEIEAMFQRNGFAHILAVSGLHISFIGMTVYKLLRRTPLPVIFQIMLSALAIYLYGIMIHAGVSTRRAIIMFFLYLGAKLVGRTYDMATALAIAALMLVMDQPLSIQNAGFLLSFGAVMAILIFFPFVKTYFNLPDKWMSNKIIGKVWEMFLLSFSVNFFTLPVLLYFYFEVPIYSPLLNLLIIPVFSLVLLFGVAGGIVSMFSLEVGSITLFPCKVIFAFYQKVCEFGEKLPNTRWIAGRPEATGIVLFYLIVMGLMLVKVLDDYSRDNNRENSNCEKNNPRNSNQEKSTQEKSTQENDNMEKNNQENSNQEKNIRNKNNVKNKTSHGENRHVTKKCVLLGVMIIGVFILSIHPQRGTTVTFLDIGQGDCCVIHTEGGKTLLIDGGSSDVKESGEKRLIPFLKAKGISQVDYVFLSHPDSDHVNAIVECLEKQTETGVSIQSIVLSAYGKNDENYLDIKKAAYEAGCQVAYFEPGNSLRIEERRGEEILLECLFPSGMEGIDDVNEQSMVILAKIGQTRFLFTGDIGEETEKQMLARLGDEFDIGVDILKVPHHGSRYSSCDEFLWQVKPRLSIISCGEGNSYGHPHMETLERLIKIGSRVVTTPECGAITVEVGGAVKTFRNPAVMMP